jgi:hypothetical protein
VYADASTKAFAAHTYVGIVDTDVSRREETWIDVSRLELAACVIAS